MESDGSSSNTYKVYKPSTGTVVTSKNVKWEAWHGSMKSALKMKEFDLSEEPSREDDSSISSDESASSEESCSTESDVSSSDESSISEENKQPAETISITSSDIEEEVVNSDYSSYDEIEIPPDKNTRRAKPRDEFNAPTVLRGRMRSSKRKLRSEAAKCVREAQAAHLREKLLEKFETAMNALTSDPNQPDHWKDMWNNPKNRTDWKDSACQEIENFLRRGAWKKFPRDKLVGRKPIAVRWVFKIKSEHDGTVRLKSRIVVKGFAQIPGVDYTENFSPVANDTSIRICVVVTMSLTDWEIDVVDIEAAFLEADLDEEVFIEWPEGIVDLGYATQEMVDTMCIQLDKAMYGLVQSPRCFFLTISVLMRKFGMVQSKADPCLWFKKNEATGELELLVAIYVDDCVVCGTRKMIEWWKTQIKKRFNISDLGNISKHIGVWYEQGEDDNGKFFRLSMDSYCKKFIDSTEDLCGTVRKANTPAYTNKVLGRKDEDEPAVKQDVYRSFVGTTLYMIKKVSPESSNAVRELSRHLDGPNPSHWRALMRLAGYLKAEPPSMKLRATESFRVIAYTDSNYATDEHDRKSVSGYVVTLGGSIVSWGSKKQDTVSLSSCEAEYIASVNCAQEIRYIQQLMEELVGKQEPALMYGDNNGAIFLSKHNHVGARTKHIDVRYHYLRELQTNGHLDYKKIKGEDNPSDIMTKNVTESIHAKHTKELKAGFVKHGRKCANVYSKSRSREDDEDTLPVG